MAEQYPTYPDSRLEEVLTRQGAVFLEPPELPQDYDELIKFRIEQRQTMNYVSGCLGEVGLGHLEVGMRGYHVVTGHVYEAMDQGYFEYPEKFDMTIPVFAGQFYMAGLNHVRGRRDLIPEHWQYPMYSKHVKNASPEARMMAFWGGHIPDLKKTNIMTNIEPKYRADYRKINKVLKSAVPDVLAEVSVTPPTRVKLLAAYLAMTDVYLMRDDQWYAARELQEQGYTADDVRNEVVHGVYRAGKLRRILHKAGDLAVKFYENGRIIPKETARATA